MKIFRACCFCGALAAIGCGGNDSSTVTKSEIDTAMLEDMGVTATITEHVAAIGVPLAAPFPDASNEEIESEMMDAVTLVVSSVESGATADLADGVLVHDTPSAPGEFTWEFDDERTTLTIAFYNQTTSGMTFSPGAEYDATMSVSENKFIDEIPAMTFSVTVE